MWYPSTYYMYSIGIWVPLFQVLSTYLFNNITYLDTYNILLKFIILQVLNLEQFMLLYLCS